MSIINTFPCSALRKDFENFSGPMRAPGTS